MARGVRRLLISALLFAGTASADGIVIDKIYHPYVEAGEQELEWRSVWQDDEPDDVGLHRFAYGRALNDRWFVEGYLIAESGGEDGFEWSGVELEALHQLTEQGEYFIDWGLLLEFEFERDPNVWEASIGVLMEKELGRRWSATANVLVGREWGEAIEAETETRLAAQLRYRHARAFEPALEFHAGEDTTVLGPALVGEWLLGNRQSLHWEGAVLFGLDNDSPDQALRLQLEYEF